MNEGVGLIVEIDPWRAQRRLDTRYVDVVVDDLEEAMTMVEEAVKKEEPKSIGLIGNAADVLPELVVRGVVPDVLTDQTPAHDPLMYVPRDLSLEQAVELREKDPEEYTKRSMETMAAHVEAMLELQKKGAVTFDYGNNLWLRAGLRPTSLLPGEGALPLGGPLRRPGRPLPDRPDHFGALPGGRAPDPLDQDGPEGGGLSRAAGSYLLAGLR
jgi:urocanate hydratase